MIRPDIVRFVSLVSLPWAALLAAHAAAQPPDPGKYSQPQFGVVEARDVQVAMRDGVKLAVDIFRPDGEGRHPGVLVQTPYNKEGGGFLKRARWFAERGYAVVNADVRGRFASEGQWDPFDRLHKTDGYDLVAWLAEQPWCSGDVGTFGLSYMGWTQWWTATEAPPALKAIVPEVAPPDQFYNCPYQQGVLSGWMMDWVCVTSGHRANIVGKGPYGGFSPTRYEDLMQLPYIDLLKRRKVTEAPWFDTIIRKNLASADYWRGIAYQGKEHYSKVRVPSLAISGWFDANFPGTPMNYIGMKQHGATPLARQPKIVIGPWTHIINRETKLLGQDFGPQAVIDWDGYVCRFLDAHLKGVDNGVMQDPPVHLFMLGRNRWRAAKDWPLPATVWTKYYLHSDGKANSDAGDGTLSAGVPGSEPADRYTYDPHHPTRSTSENGHLDGPRDARAWSGGNEVLVYTTPPLEAELEVAGPITATLFAATSARDCDWMMRLVDVHPDGYAALLCDGVLRARCRDGKRSGAFNPNRLSTIEPGKIYQYTLEFWRACGNAFLPGHRVRIEISSSFYPYYARNPCSGDDNIGLATEEVIAEQTVYHDAEHPSHVVLPVIPVRQ